PLSIARDGEYLYFHSAMEGKKVDIFKNNPYVSLAFVGNVQVPEMYTKEELEEISKDKSKTKLLISNVFTTEFESAIVKGKIERLENQEEKVKAMELICRKFTPSKMKYFEMAVEAGLGRANVYRIKIENITAKRKKYDSSGLEMKWGRQE
ncbi:MAG TPA: pyridoxamine 5'-phosphate oxidase family protein, partial [Clostridia bacterium]|nr:pyridoxamine 5'-phosphate oxidase family protein [Clostridia bacterium]